MSFVHLHNHTPYSLLDGACHIDDMFALAKQYDMPAVAVTDHGNMFGAIDFYEAGLSSGIKPIIGLEAYIAPGDCKHKTIIPGLKSTSFHLILLAENAIGYHNLCKLSTLSYKEGYYYKPRIDLKSLKEHADGLICSTACLQGELAASILGRHFKEPNEVIAQYLDIFDKDHFYLEIHDHAIAEESTVRRAVLDLAAKHKVRIVAAQDAHYLRPTDAKAHEILLCVQTSDRLSNPNHFKYTTNQLYFRTPEEMKALFSAYPGAIENTLRIADMCSTDLGIGLGQLRLPVFVPPDGSSPDDYLEALVKRGFRKFYPGAKLEVIQRLEYELSVIKKAKFSSYFLVVQDIVNWAKGAGILVGPGRGSAAGSIVSYCLNITEIDPIQHNLMFERFLNPDRISMPDIDLDFADDRRQEVVTYITNKYGEDKVSQIITFGTLNAKSVVRDVARVLDQPYEVGDTIAKAIPEVADITIEQAMELNPALRDMSTSPNLPYKEIIEYAKVLEGLKRQSGVHAAGVVVASEPLQELLPMCRAKNKEMSTQYDMYSVDKLGLLKIDVLGLKTLRVMDNTLRRVAKGDQGDYEAMLNLMRTLPLDMPEVIELFAAGRTVGIFQFESAGMQSYLRQIGVTKFEDLAVMNALYRPGPIDSKMIDIFVDCRVGKSKPVYLDPRLEDILKDTQGVMVFQEQIMAISRAIAGYTLSEADTLRKAMGKKIKELMAENEDQFISRAVANKTNESIASEIWRQMETFSRYGFNKAHATGYAYLAYLTAWLKVTFPEQYMASLISSESDSDSLKLLFAECRNMGIKIELPDVNLSSLDFSDSKGSIRFGLRSIKGVGDSGASELLAKRGDSPYVNLYDLCSRCDLRKVHKGVMRALIQSGAFDCFGETRENLLFNLDKFMASGSYKRKQLVQGQITVSDILPQLATGPLMDKVEPAPMAVKLHDEYELLGVYVSGHPLDLYDNLSKRITNANTISYTQLPDNSEIRLLGIVRDIVKKVNKRGDPYMIVRIEDKVGTLGTMVRGQQYKEYDGKILKDEVYVLSGGVQADKRRQGVSWVSIDKISKPEEIKVPKSNRFEGLDYVWEVEIAD